MMLLALIFLGVSVLFDTIFSVIAPKKKKPYYTIVVASQVLLLAVLAGYAMAIRPSIFSVLLLLITVTRIINLMRLVENRMNIFELRLRTLRTSLLLGLATVLDVCIIALTDWVYVYPYQAAYAQIVAAMLFALSVLIGRAKYRLKLPQHSDVVPTVSVCIPARNESEDLPGCLDSVINSNYRKLEILVLDDCSHDKTPAIIKQYAHAGVRFINGKEPRPDWLSKNAAYDRLADEAKGDILMFIGVDIRLAPHSIGELVGQLGYKDMLSVMPRRTQEHESSFFIQPLRYWWELGLWRFGFRHKPVLSSCWMIRAETLNKLGRLESVKKAISPEVVFARKLDQLKHYSFIVGTSNLGVISKKSPRDQFQTAIRKRYPQVGRAPERLLLVILVEAFFFIGPYFTGVVAFFTNDSLLLLLSLCAIILLTVANAEIYKLAISRLWYFGFISVIPLVFADWFLMLKSMHAYEFGKVVWKDRNICIPMYKVIPNLPKLPD